MSSLLHNTTSEKMIIDKEEEFLEWLESCPVKYYLLDSDYNQQSYQFIVMSEEEWTTTIFGTMC